MAALEKGWVHRPALIGLNCSLVLMATLAGWTTSAFRGSRLDVAITDVEASGTILSDARHIATSNLRVVAAMLLGAATLSVFTVATLLLNSYNLGFGLSAIFHRSPAVSLIMLSYVPLEFLAFALAASAAQGLTLAVIGSLTMHTRVPLKWILNALFASVVILCAAAIIEAHVKHVVVERLALP